MEPIKILTDSPFNKIDNIRRILFYDDFIAIDAVVNRTQKIFVKKLEPTRTMILTDQDEIGKELTHKRIILTPYGIAAYGETHPNHKKFYFISQSIQEMEIIIPSYIPPNITFPKILANECAVLTTSKIYTTTQTIELDNFDTIIEYDEVYWYKNNRGYPYTYTNKGLTQMIPNKKGRFVATDLSQGILTMKEQKRANSRYILFDTYTATQYHIFSIEEKINRIHPKKAWIKYKDFVIAEYIENNDKIMAISIHRPSSEAIIDTEKLDMYRQATLLITGEKLYYFDVQKSEIIQIDIEANTPEVTTYKLPHEIKELEHNYIADAHVWNNTLYIEDRLKTLYCVPNIT